MRLASLSIHRSTIIGMIFTLLFLICLNANGEYHHDRIDTLVYGWPKRWLDIGVFPTIVSVEAFMTSGFVNGLIILSSVSIPEFIIWRGSGKSFQISLITASLSVIAFGAILWLNFVFVSDVKIDEPQSGGFPMAAYLKASTGVSWIPSGMAINAVVAMLLIVNLVIISEFCVDEIEAEKLRNPLATKSDN